MLKSLTITFVNKNLMQKIQTSKSVFSDAGFINKRIMNTITVLLLSMISSSAMANYALSTNGKTVNCLGGDDQSFVLNAKRSTIKYTVEGESLGPKPILKTDSDGDTWRSYTTEEGTLTLSDQEDQYQFKGDDSTMPLKCK